MIWNMSVVSHCTAGDRVDERMSSRVAFSVISVIIAGVAKSWIALPVIWNGVEGLI